MADTMTVREFLALFDRGSSCERWLNAVDSQEYLELVTYLVQRSQRGSA